MPKKLVKISKPLGLENTSRANFCNYYKLDDIEFAGFPDYPEVHTENSEMHTVRDIEKDRFDNIAYKHYQTAFLNWFLYQSNDIVNPFSVEENVDLIIASPEAYINFFLRGRK